MKDNNTFALKMNKCGELLLENSDDAVKAKYKPDSLLLCAPVSYLLMLFCVVIDIAFFRSLFVRISYDSPIMIWGQVAGLAFAADVVAAFAGILAKKIRQGLSHDKFNLALLLAVPIFADHQRCTPFLHHVTLFCRRNSRCRNDRINDHCHCNSCFYICRQFCHQLRAVQSTGKTALP